MHAHFQPAFRTLAAIRRLLPILMLAGLSASAALAQNFTVDPGSLTFNGVPTGSLSDPQDLTITAEFPTTVTVQIVSGNFIQVQQGGVNVSDPTKISVRVSAAGQAIGVYQGTIRLSTQSKQINVPITMSVTAIGLFSSNPTSLSFSAAIEGSGNPSSIPVMINSSGGVLNYTLSTDTGSGPNWIILSRLDGTTGSTTFNVSINSSTLAAGTYNGKIVVQSVTTTDRIQIPVTLLITAGPTLSVTPTEPPPFLYQLAGTAPAPQTLTVTTSGAASTYTVAQSPQVGWLVVSPLNGSAGTNPGKITLSVNTNGLNIGTYTTNVIVTPDGGTPLQPIPVKLIVSANPILTLSTDTLAFVTTIGGSAPSPQTVTVSATGTGAPLTYIATPSDPWITVTPATGSTPTPVSIGIKPGGLEIGNHTGTVVFRPNNISDEYSLTLRINLTITDVAEVSAGPAVMLFTHQVGQSKPQSQAIALKSSGQAVQFQLEAIADACGGTWLAAQSAQFQTPATIAVGVNPDNVQPGICSGIVRVTYDSGAGQRQLNIPITMIVSNDPLLRISLEQGYGQITVRKGQAVDPMRATVTSTNPNVQFNYAITSTSEGGAWLATPSFGATPSLFETQVLPGALQPGHYTGQVTVSSTGLPTTAFNIPVSLTVLPDVTVTVTPQTLQFSQTQGGAASAPQNIAITSTDQGATFTATITQISGGDWLAIDRTSGTAAGNIQVSVKPNSLPVNTYQARINLAFQNAATNPITINVTLVVAQAKTLSISRDSLTFNAQIDDTAPPADQTFSVAATPGPADFTVGTTVSGSASGWLTATPASGTTPGTVTVKVNPSGLAVGTYTGTVTVTSPGAVGSPKTVAVTLNVAGLPPPLINVVTNTASNTAGPIVGGELITLKGVFTPASVQPTLFTVTASNTVASTLAGIRVLFDNIPGTPIYVSREQINVIVPYEIVGRATASMVVEYQGVKSSAISVLVGSAFPGIFTLNSAGTGQAAALNEDGSYNGPPSAAGAAVQTKPAPFDKSIVIYATGGGQTNPTSSTGSVTPLSPLRFLPGTVTAKIGGLPARVDFAGAAPGLVTGVIQINLHPDPAVHGSNLSVEITINGVPSPSGPTVAVE